MRRERHETRQERFAFDLDMLLLQTFGQRALPDDVAVRIAFRAERELTFLAGLASQTRSLVRAGLL